MGFLLYTVTVILIFLLQFEEKKVVEKKVVEKKEPELPPIRALPSPYSTPRVIWFQTDIHIKINILLSDVTDCVLNVLRGKVLFFR